MENQIKKCNKCKEEFDLGQEELSFYEMMKVPPPNICQHCRLKMVLVWRNEISLYSGRKCDFCGKNILSIYNPKSPYKVYCYDCYHSDKWGAKDYFLEYNPAKSFVDQMQELLIRIPKLNLYISNLFGESINSEYMNQAGGCKNCYFIFNADPSEDILYSKGINKCFDSSDLYFSAESNLCYECVNIQKSSGVIWGKNSINCVNSYFVSSCSGLINCFGCVNLRNKSNCWFNEQLTSEEYREKINEIFGSYSKIEETREKFEKFCLKFPHRENNNLKVVDCSGDYLFECKNVKNSIESSGDENCQYLVSVIKCKDSLGVVGWGSNSECLLNVSSSGISNHIIGAHGVESCRNILWGFFNRNCHDCIGCVSLRNGKYSILNKEYEKEEYEKLKEHIINELTEQGLYGLMMPKELSPFAYNETIAQDNMPLTKEEAIAQGFRWEDDIQMTKGKETLPPEEIEDHIKDVKDSIIEEILKCIECERNYKITEQELLFYRKMILPIPRKCFFCRHKDRVVRRGPYKFWDRKCDHCGKDIKTNYGPDRKEIIYCEKCYQQEVI